MKTDKHSPSGSKLRLRASERQMLSLFLCFAAAALCGCGARVPSPPDAAVTDAGEVALIDAGSGADAGPPDAGDAGSTSDAGQPDAGPLPDAGIEPDGGSTFDASIPDGGVRVRVVAANTSSGSAQSYDPGEGIRMFEGLHPDIVLIQELNYATNSTVDLQRFADLSFGPGFTVVREQGAQIPNGVITRFPILASGVWTDPQVANRGFTWAHIDLPGPRDLWAISVHLLTTSAGARSAEADDIMLKIAATVPAGAWMVLGGDFNTSTRSEACVTKLTPRFATAGPYPADQNGNANTSGTRSKPHDWVLLSNELQPFEVPLVIGASTYLHGLVLDTRVYTPLTEVAPALATDSAAAGMQHMPVAKDLRLVP